MRVRTAQPGDFAAIHQIQKSSPLAPQWDPAGHQILVAEHSSGLAGFLAWRPVAADENEILNLAIAPAFRRQGIAQSLLRAMPRVTTFLEVRESNTPARALYTKCGFLEAGIRFGYYSDPSESAIVMRLQS